MRVTPSYLTRRAKSPAAGQPNRWFVCPFARRYASMKKIALLPIAILSFQTNAFECKEPGGQFEVDGLIKIEKHEIDRGNVNITATFPANYNGRESSKGATLYIITEAGWQLGAVLPTTSHDGNRLQVFFGANPEYLDNVVLEVNYNQKLTGKFACHFSSKVRLNA